MTNQIINEKALPPEVIISKILSHPKTSGKMQMSEIAKFILDLSTKGVIITNILCYKTGSSVYCEDLDRFVSKLVSFGYATDSSPVTLTEDGKKQCENFIKKNVDRLTEQQLAKLDKILDNYTPDS